jgi:hypothetical protein
VARPDLLALTDDALAALANRGIVKRAVREYEAGGGPALVDSPDGTVTATWPDGTSTTLAPGRTLEQAGCSCAASGVCRHRVLLAIAYRTHRPREDQPDLRSPGGYDDDQLAQHLGERAMTAARRVLRAGYAARVRRPTPDDPVPTVELASVTVRFLVAGELGYARADAARGSRPDAVALAVWACRAADCADPTGAVVDVQVGGGAAASPTAALDATAQALAELLADGVTRADAGHDAALAAARRALDAGNLRWPVDALDALVEQVRAYRERTSSYSPRTAAGLVAELVARARCAGGGASPASTVLGTQESTRTPMRLARLTALGARLRGTADLLALEVYLAHPESATVLVLRRAFPAAQDGTAPELSRVLSSRAGGHRLAALAAAEVVTESAVRAADRSVHLASSQLARTSISPSSGSWSALPPGLLLGDLDAAAAGLATRPPAPVRPRVAAHDLRAVLVDEVEDLSWHPGAQQLRARVRAPAGTLLLRAQHTSAAPGAVDALQSALSGQVRAVAGHLHREAGQLVLEPTAVAVDGRVVVPDLTPPQAGAPVPVGVHAAGDPLQAAVEQALDVCAAVVHAGWRPAPVSWAGRAQRAADDLRRAGLPVAATALQELPAALAGDPTGALASWADVHLRLLVTAEQL